MNNVTPFIGVNPGGRMGPTAAILDLAIAPFVPWWSTSPRLW